MVVRLVGAAGAVALAVILLVSASVVVLISALLVIVPAAIAIGWLVRRAR